MITAEVRLERYAGRSELLTFLSEQVGQAAEATGSTARVIAIEAPGGLGKTYTLQVLPELARDVLPNIQFLVPPIIDFYDPENRDPLAIMQRLVEWLGESQTPFDADQKASFRTRYDQARHDYIEALGNPRRKRDQALQELTNVFASIWQELCADALLLLRFDTAELLLPPTDIPEQAFIHQLGSSADRLTAWFLQILPLMSRSLILLAGRPAAEGLVQAQTLSQRLAAESWLRHPSGNSAIIRLETLSSPAELRAFGEKCGGVAFGDAEIPHLQEITGGLPLLLGAYLELRQHYPGQAGKPATRADFEALLLDTTFNPLLLQQPLDRPALLRVCCLYLLSVARRGLTREELQQCLQELLHAGHLPVLAAPNENEAELHTEIEQVLERLPGELLIKRVPVRRADQEIELLQVHDEVFVLLDRSGRLDRLAMRAPALNWLKQHTRELAHQAQQQVARISPSELLRALADQLYYGLTEDFVDGYRCYALGVNYLLRQRLVDQAELLGEVFWGLYSFGVKREGEQFFPYQQRLAELQPAILDLMLIGRDEELRRVKLANAQGRYTEALQQIAGLDSAVPADSILADLVTTGLLKQPAAEHPWRLVADSQTQRSARDTYFLADLAVAWATALVQGAISMKDQTQLEQLFDDALDLLNLRRSQSSATPYDTLLRLRRWFFLGRLYTLRGQVRRRQQRYDEAIKDYERGIEAFWKYAEQPQPEQGRAAAVWLNDAVFQEQAQVYNNLAYAYTELGNLEKALEASNNALRYQEQISDYYRALLLNTRALVLLRRGRWEESESTVDLARQYAERANNPRGLGLVHWTEGQVARRQMKLRDQPKAHIDQHFVTAARLLAGSISDLREVRMDRARLARDLAEQYRRLRARDPQAYLRACDEAANQVETDGTQQVRDLVIYYHELSQGLVNELIKELHAALDDDPSRADLRMQLADVWETLVGLDNNHGLFDEAEAGINEIEFLLSDTQGRQLPRYAQVVCGKVALQRGYRALFGLRDTETALREFAIALARALLYNSEHRDLAAFEGLIQRWTNNQRQQEGSAWDRRLDQLRELAYAVSAIDLPYQAPDIDEWKSAWSAALNRLPRSTDSNGAT